MGYVIWYEISPDDPYGQPGKHMGIPQITQHVGPGRFHGATYKWFGSPPPVGPVFSSPPALPIRSVVSASRALVRVFHSPYLDERVTAHDVHHFGYLLIQSGDVM